MDSAEGARIVIYLQATSAGFTIPPLENMWHKLVRYKFEYTKNFDV